MTQTAARRTQGPWVHRALIWFFTGLLGLLSYWLLGFVMQDIGTWPGPDYAALEARMTDAALRDRGQGFRVEVERLKRRMEEDRARQGVLRDSTENAERTMTQLIEIQRLSLERGGTSTDQQQAALREAQQLFLANQQRYQQINDALSASGEELRQQEQQLRDWEVAWEQAQRPVREEYARLQTAHQLRVAALKLAVLVPLLAVCVVLFQRGRQGLYAPIVNAFGLATLLKVVQVMHEYFPRRYFKYVLVVALLVLAFRVLIHLLRMKAHPRRDWLLRQFREAYEHFLCPVCDYPIRRGPLRFASWTRRSLRRLSLRTTAANEPETPYTCPVCQTTLFEDCPSCHGVRHSLLPACTHCGAEKAVIAAEG